MLSKVRCSWSWFKIVFARTSRCIHQNSFATGERSLSKRKYLSRMLLNVPSPFDISATQMKKSQCKSQLLLMYNELIYGCHHGSYYIMPNALRALEKLIKLIDEELQEIGAQKISMPTLVSGGLWKQTGRWDTAELFKLKDNQSREFCLGPTHEELVTTLFAGQPITQKRLPVMLYQITRKFRDEKRPRYGLLRSREFEMKDLYTFDKDLESATETYNLICDTYAGIYDKLGLSYVKTEGATGNIGGQSSHEFHLAADIGEDTIYQCSSCGFATNLELIDADKINEDQSTECPKCSTTILPRNAIEVGHAFLLGTKYSSVFKANYKTDDGKFVLAEMGCYGLGVTRILQAGVEVLSQGSNIVWPSLIAPYQVCIVPNLDKSKKFNYDEIADDVYDKLNEMRNLRGEVVIFDSSRYTIGKKVSLAIQQGYPYIIVIGKRVTESPAVYEVINTREGRTEFMSLDQVIHKMSEIHTL